MDLMGMRLQLDNTMCVSGGIYLHEFCKQILESRNYAVNRRYVVTFIRKGRNVAVFHNAFCVFGYL